MQEEEEEEEEEEVDKGKKHETLPTFTEFYCLFPQSLFGNLFKVFKIIWNWDFFELVRIFIVQGVFLTATPPKSTKKSI